MVLAADAPPAAFYSTGTLLRQRVETILSSEKQESIHSSDFLHVGYLWRVVEPLLSTGDLYLLIRKRREEIFAQKELWRPRILEWHNDPFFAEVQNCTTLIPIVAGAGAAYGLLDESATPRFVVKPVDEDIFCLNNHKSCASPFNEKRYRVRPGIPLYRSAQTDVACSRIAALMGIDAITPRTIMGIFSSSDFFDLSDRLAQDEQLEFLALGGMADKEKLCSIQEYLPDTQDLTGLTDSWSEMTEIEILDAFDQKDFELMNIFIWTLYDNDAHGSNILTYVKEIDEIGKPLYGLKKIDNGLSFPETNTFLVNLLSYFPNALLPLSNEGKQLIAALPLDKIIAELKFWEMESSIPAFQERIQILQTLAARDNLTLREINLRLLALGHPDGPRLALSSLSQGELEELLDEASSR